MRNLRFHATHGVMAQERITGGDFELYELVKREMMQPSNLLEHVAGRIGESIFREMAGVTSVDIEVCKVNPPMGADCDGASVELHLTSEKTEKTV